MNVYLKHKVFLINHFKKTYLIIQFIARNVFMNTLSRTLTTKKNAKASIINRIITLLTNFITRSIFIQFLGSKYLGVGGMFGNVFSVLSLCELGFGAAASQAMFEPLANADIQKVKAISKYYETVYRYISLITFSLSIAALPFLSTFFPDIKTISGYRYVYLLYVFHQIASYYFAPKRAIISCDQRMYIIMNARTITSIAASALQIAFLYLTKDYLIYISLRILMLTSEGIFIELYARRKYFFDRQNITPLSEECKSLIKRNTLSLAIHRIGGVINNSTDSILLSSCLGLSHMGIYSNYSLIINSLGSFISLAINSASAAVGNLGATKNSKKSSEILQTLTFANFFLITNCTSILLCLINPVISLWLGPHMCFSFTETVVIIACFYISYIRDPIQISLHNYGVFKSTGYIYLARGILNLFLSYAFVKKIGVTGVFAGTLLSTIGIVLFTEPYFLFKNALGLKSRAFIKKYTCYIVSSVIICALCVTVCSKINASNLFGVALRFLLCLSLTNLMLLMLYRKTSEFSKLFSIILSKK